MLHLDHYYVHKLFFSVIGCSYCFVEEYCRKNTDHVRPSHTHTSLQFRSNLNIFKKNINKCRSIPFVESTDLLNRIRVENRE